MARCAVGFLGDDVDDRQILETSLERKVNAAFMPQAAAVATPQAMEEDVVEWAEPAAKASTVADSAAGPRGHIDTLISKTCRSIRATLSGMNDAELMVLMSKVNIPKVGQDPASAASAASSCSASEHQPQAAPICASKAITFHHKT